MIQIGDYRRDLSVKAADHDEAVHHCLAKLTDPLHGCLGDASEVSAIALKTVHGGRTSGVQRVTADVLAAMEEMCSVAPAHNPPYIAAMRLLAEKLPQIPLVAVFETDFHATIPQHNRLYAIPYKWRNPSTSAVGGSTGPAIATLPSGRPSCLVAATCGSSPAIWAVPVPCAPFARARAWPRRWA